MDKWDGRFIRLAYEVAAWSKDPDKQVGAIAVSPDNRNIATAYNGPPSFFDDEVWQKMSKREKNSLAVHAEINLLINSKLGFRGWTIYITEAPCTGCASAISQLPIAKLVCPKPVLTSSWYMSQFEGKKLLDSRRFETVYFDRELYAPKELR